MDSVQSVAPYRKVCELWECLMLSISSWRTLWKGLTCIISWDCSIPGILLNDSSILLAPVRVYSFLYLRAWDCGDRDGLCKAPALYITCWLNMEIIHTCIMNEGLCFPYVTSDGPSGDVYHAGIYAHKRVFSHLIQISWGISSTCTWENTCFHSSRSQFEKIKWSFLVSSIKSFHLKCSWERLHRNISQLILSKEVQNPSCSFYPLFFFFFMRDSSQGAGYQMSYVTKDSVSLLSFLSSCFQWVSLFFLYDWNNYPDKAKDWDRCSP